LKHAVQGSIPAMPKTLFNNFRFTFRVDEFVRKNMRFFSFYFFQLGCD